MTDRAVVAVIGAGFSGLLTALHLLAQLDGPQVRLIERRNVFGRGLAYSTDNPDHLLNVRVANMSAFPEAPDHFQQWLAGRSGWRANGGFVTRGVYGDYLQSLLREAAGGAFGPDRLLLEGDEVLAAQPSGARWRLRMGMGRELTADTVVLALGPQTPAAPVVLDDAVLASGRYVGDPWAEQALAGELGQHLLLIGTGLTMVDVTLALARPGRRLTAISRHGLLPTSHAAARAIAGGRELDATPSMVLQTMRRWAREGDWREVVDSIRPSVRPLWMSWTQGQRRQFLRHLRPYWDVHRHRMAPPVAREIADKLASGELTAHAGAIRDIHIDGGQLGVAWRSRGAEKARKITASAVINCAGHQGDLTRSTEPLIRSLLDQHLIRPDPCALGADVNARSQPLDRWGAATSGLYAVGPLTRGAFWEMTSVPDIRRQAQDVGREILAGAALGAIAAPERLIG